MHSVLPHTRLHEVEEDDHHEAKEDAAEHEELDAPDHPQYESVVHHVVPWKQIIRG